MTSRPTVAPPTSTISEWVSVEETPQRNRSTPQRNRSSNPSRYPSKSTPFPTIPPQAPPMHNRDATARNQSIPMMMNNNDDEEDELSNVLMAWYYSGYYTGQYKARQEARQEIAMLRAEIKRLLNTKQF